MKKMNKLFLSALLAAGFALPSFAQSSTDAAAYATIVSPLTITKTSDLMFGNIVANPLTPGTVVLGTFNNRNSADLILAGGSKVKSGMFNLTGDIDRTFSVSFPEVVVISGPGNATMTVDSWTTTLANQLSENAFSDILNEGSQNFFVGASLHVNANQTIGQYSGSFTVSVDYN